jgi:transposase InsO family protein
VSYIVDVFSRIIVGWRVAVHRRTDIVLAAVEMASWSRVGLVARSDADSRFTSRRCGERLAELGATPSIGSVGDSFDSALVESTIGLHNSKLIRGRAQSCGEPGRGTRVSTSGPSASSGPDGGKSPSYRISWASQSIMFHKRATAIPPNTTGCSSAVTSTDS